MQNHGRVRRFRNCDRSFEGEGVVFMLVNIITVLKQDFAQFVTCVWGIVAQKLWICMDLPFSYGSPGDLFQEGCEDHDS